MSVPIRHGRDKKQKMKEIEIFNGNGIGWQKHHWQTLCSAYRRSPYFEYYEDELQVFYEKEYKLLMNFNQDLFNWVCEKLDVALNVEFTKEFHKTVEPPTEDYRSVLRPNANKDTRPDWLLYLSLIHI